MANKDNSFCVEVGFRAEVFSDMQHHLQIVALKIVSAISDPFGDGPDSSTRADINTHLTWILFKEGMGMWHFSHRSSYLPPRGSSYSITVKYTETSIMLLIFIARLWLKDERDQQHITGSRTQPKIKATVTYCRKLPFTDTSQWLSKLFWSMVVQPPWNRSGRGRCKGQYVASSLIYP